MTNTSFPTTLETRQTIPRPRFNDDSLAELQAWIEWATDELIAHGAKIGADASAVATSHDSIITGMGVLASGEIDHADTSPVTLLAAGAADRNIVIIGWGTEAAATTPDIDIGETDTTDKFLVDWLAGAWTVGMAFVVTGTLTASKALLATIATAGSAGKIAYVVLGMPDRS